MRLLRVFRLGLINTRFFWQISAVVTVGNRLASGGNGAVIHLHAIGSHVSNRTVFIKPLCDPHRMAGRKAKFARRFLLQGRGGERRLRIAGDRLRFNAVDTECAGLHRRARGFCLGLGLEIHLVMFFAKIAQQPGFEPLPFMLHIGFDRPIFLGLKSLDFALAFDDQAERNRLHPTGRLSPRQFAPQHGRQRETNEIIKRPPRKICFDQIDIQFARFGHRLKHGGFGNRVKSDALNVLRQCFFLGQHFLHMPTDRLALPVRVGREDEAVCLLRLVGDRFQLFGFVSVIIP